jgi:phosphoribosylformylglycinamidine synthase
MVDLAVEQRLGTLIHKLNADKIISAAHDVSDGGPLIALCEMALASNIGAAVTPPENGPENGANAAMFFGEDQGRIMVATRNPPDVIAAANAAQLYAVDIAKTGGDSIIIGEQDISLSDLRSASDSFFKDWMGD